MARDTRRIGIRTAEVRLPGPASFGPALVKTAGAIAERAFEKAADKRTQEAVVAANALNFERDPEGNLIAPTVPIAENGLLAPSIYDRKYTQMVGQRYLQQTQIDVSERINLIASENPFDPEAFRVLAEGYVDKVTELAPDFVKADVNNTAQIKMVEHFNHIIRVKAERDHTEARGLQLQTIDNHMTELGGYVSGNAEPDVIGAKMLEARAAIEQGDELHFWLDDEKQLMLDSIDRQFVVSKISSLINGLPPGDDVAAKEMALALNGFANGEGTFPMVDEAGNIADVPLEDVPMAQDERILIAEFATKLLATKHGAFTDVQDARLNRDWEDFFNWFSPHALNAITPGSGVQLDIGRLYVEFDKAHRKVVDLGYDDALRETIRDLITQQVGGGRNMSAEQTAFDEDWQAWNRMVRIETEKRLADTDPQSLTQQEALELRHGVLRDTGGLSSGNQQTAANSRFVSEYYSGMAARDLTGPEGRDYWNDVLQAPTQDKWAEVEWLAKYQFSPIGIWPQELSAAIIGKMNDPEGMSQRTLEDTMRLTRAFWDQPTFQNNMTDGNALGTQVGRTLDHLFRMGGQPTAEEAQYFLEKFRDPDWSPQKVWASRDSDDRDAYIASADKAIDNFFNANWRTGWMRRGLQTGTVGFNPFDDDLAGVPPDVKFDVMQRVIANAGFIDSSQPEMFNIFIAQSVDKAMHDKGYAPTQIGYSRFRHNDSFSHEWTRPDAAIVAFPPEYFARTDNQGNLTPSGTVNKELMGLVTENFQVVLDHYWKQRFGNLPVNEQPARWVAGVNTGLRYNGDASAKLNTPHWDIMLVRAGGLEPEVLNESGLFDGTNFTFNMDEAVFRFNKIQDVKRREAQERRAKIRLDYQTGQSVYPTNPGSQQ
jgi:hypothetical protein